MMRRPGLLVLAFCAMAASAMAAVMAAHLGDIARRESSPLAAIKPVFEFGEVRQRTLSASFDLFNQSSTPLQILHVVQTCDCTNVKVAAKEVAPSEHVVVRCSWDTKRKRGRSSSSLLVVYKKSGAQGTKHLRLSLVATVIPEVLFTPTELAFERGVGAIKTVEFSCHFQEDFAILKAYCTQQAFQVTSFSERSVTVSFDPTLWPGADCSYDLVVETSSSVEPTCRVPLVVVASLRR